ncbi:MAG: FMN-binding glutamate synthase family protein [Planctomycetes bacterium]|nr:FMN-binding glutamate synthase family protein [Planctomycetota bacterium]
MVRRAFLLFAVLAPLTILLLNQIFWDKSWLLFIPVGPIILLGLWDITQRRSSLRRIYPVIAHGRYLFESIRPEIQQYFVENNIDGRPFNREQRSLVYQRAKNVTDTLPFGTQRDVDRAGYEWIPHSIAAITPAEEEERVRFGGEHCDQPYFASHLNISAMSFGSLSTHAVMALNRGAKAAGCWHNTGEGGISPYHLQGGDLVWQLGTGYFGARAADGGFDVERYRTNAQRPEVKMIELKLSQGAKPGHGGILPAAKVTPEIAEIRGVPLGKDVLSPPYHKAFDSPRGLIDFCATLRRESGGKPVGFKLCIGRREEFLAICKAMLEADELPDFITVDGAEGGTGAAPLELSNRAGVPLREGLSFVDNALRGVGLRDKIRVVAAGKIITGFDLFRTRALGADVVNSARGMMMALGCIQAVRCNTNHCPVGIATQDPARVQGLDVDDKTLRVQRFHHNTIHAFLELLAACGLQSPREIEPEHVHHRVEEDEVAHLGQLYPRLDDGLLVRDPEAAPAEWQAWWQAASPDSFKPQAVPLAGV